jgi:hypothetical protein
MEQMDTKPANALGAPLLIGPAENGSFIVSQAGDNYGRFGGKSWAFSNVIDLMAWLQKQANELVLSKSSSLTPGEVVAVVRIEAQASIEARGALVMGGDAAWDAVQAVGRGLR